MKPLKYGLFALAGLALLASAIAAYLVATFDARDYHARIVDLVKEKTGRALTITGATRLSFWPDTGIELGALTLSERNSSEAFARVEGVRVTIDTQALLSGIVVAREITLRGASVQIVRYEDGHLNIDDLIKRDGESRAFDIGRLALERCHVSFDDRAAHTRWDLADIVVVAGRLTDRVPTDMALSLTARNSAQTIELAAALKARLTLDLTARRHSLHGAQLELKGRVPGLTNLSSSITANVDVDAATANATATQMNAQVSGRRGEEALNLQLGSTTLSIGTDAARADSLHLTLNAAGPAGKTQLRLAAPVFERAGDEIGAKEVALDFETNRAAHRIVAHARTRIVAALKARTVELSAIDAGVSATGPRVPQGTVAGTLKGDGRVDLTRENVSLKLTGKVADTGFKVQLSAAGFASPVYTFAADLDRIDLARYASPHRTQKNAEPPSLDLSPLTNFPATGTIRIGTLIMAQTRANDVRLELK